MLDPEAQAEDALDASIVTVDSVEKPTEYSLNWIPFGGFARMKGEDAGDMSEGSFNAASAGGRARAPP